MTIENVARRMHYHGNLENMIGDHSKKRERDHLGSERERELVMPPQLIYSEASCSVI